MFKRTPSPGTVWTPELLAYFHRTGSLIAEMHTLTREWSFKLRDEGPRFSAIGVLVAAPAIIVQVDFNYKETTSPGVMTFTNLVTRAGLAVSVKLLPDVLPEIRRAFEWSAMSRQSNIEITFKIVGADHTQRSEIPVCSFSVSSMIQLSTPKV